jgi:hypothetical protein
VNNNILICMCFLLDKDQKTEKHERENSLRSARNLEDLLVNSVVLLSAYMQQMAREPLSF